MRDLVRALMEVAQADHAMAADVWVLVFPIVWATLSERKQQQVDLAKPIISLLSREYHMRQAHLRPNVVQARSRCLSLLTDHPASSPLQSLGHSLCPSGTCAAA